MRRFPLPQVMLLCLATCSNNGKQAPSQENAVWPGESGACGDNGVGWVCPMSGWGACEVGWGENSDLGNAPVIDNVTCWDPGPNTGCSLDNDCAPGEICRGSDFGGGGKLQCGLPCYCPGSYVPQYDGGANGDDDPACEGLCPNPSCQGSCCQYPCQTDSDCENFELGQCVSNCCTPPCDDCTPGSNECAYGNCVPCPADYTCNPDYGGCCL